MTKIGVINGSIRKDSFSGRLAKALQSVLPENVEAEEVQIDHLALYNQDYDGNDPEEYPAFRKQIERLDGVIFVTPEHNRSVPAALKNALDVASRPYGENKWAGKPALIASQSISVLSGFGANHHLRQSLTFLDMPTVQQPEVYIAESQNVFGENGEFLKEGTEDFLKGAVDKLVSLIK